LAAVGWSTNLAVAKVSIAAQSAETIVTRVRRHRPPPVSALRLQLFLISGDVAGERFTLFALGHCDTCKTTHGTEHCNRDEFLDHALPPLLHVLN
jgi:hypothetical protein